MNFSLREITTHQFDDYYDEFSGEKTFLQTSKYGKYREGIGEKIYYLGLFEKEKLSGISLIQKINAKRGIFLHLPHGPLTEKREGGNMEKRKGFLSSFLEAYVTLGKKEKCDFVRISPLLSVDSISDFKNQGFRPASVHLVNPEKTWTLDISLDEEEILKNMRKSTRYEVKRIKKCGIKTKVGNQKEDLDIFWKLHKETVARQGFVPFTRASTEVELDVFGEDCQIFSAEIDGQYLSSSVIIFDNHAAYYHQGASSYSKFPVAHATIWSAILEAKRRGCREFNFWGICGDEEKKHPWFGLSKFKRGFGGGEKNFLHVQDYPISGKYWLNFAVEKYRKWKRRY